LDSWIEAPDTLVQRGRAVNNGYDGRMKIPAASTRFVQAAVMIAAAWSVSVPPSVGEDAPSREAQVDKSFLAALDTMDAAQLQLQNGRAEPFKALWSHAGDVTLSGGFGGTVEKGWEAVGRRLDWVGTQFKDGTNTHERIVTGSSGDLAYVVQSEHLRFQVPGQDKRAARDYRVTMIFRRESAGWRIVHRQADSQTTKQAPQ
jgi:ketosteroid isomerase-like protein